MAAITRSLRTVRSSTSSLLNTVRSFSLSKHPSTSRPSLSNLLRSNEQLSRPACHALSQLNQVRFRVDRAGGSGYSPLTSTGSNVSERGPTEMAPLFPGCDYQHWLIVMDKPGGDGANKQQMIDCYVQTLSQVLGSAEEAMQKIYNVSCERYFGFGCEIDEETSNKLEGLPGVLFVLPDSYVDEEFKDYGAELFENGQIVSRPPERQRRINDVTSASRDNRNGNRPMRRRVSMR